MNACTALLTLEAITEGDAAGRHAKAAAGGLVGFAHLFVCEAGVQGRGSIRL